MWWPFKKKKVEENKKRSRKFLEYRSITIDVGKTLIEYDFLDGRKLKSWVYGITAQYTDQGSSTFDKTGKYTDAVVSYINSYTSIDKAQNQITSINSTYTVVLTDDDKKPRKSMSGNVIGAKILKTENYKEEFQEAYLIEKEF